MNKAVPWILLACLGCLTAGAATFFSFQEGDLRMGPGLGVGIDGTLVDSNYKTRATFLRSSSPDTPPDGNQLLAGTGGSPVFRTLLGFDVSSLPNIVGSDASRIDSVILNLTHDTAGAGGGFTQSIYLNSPFNETTATWNEPRSPGTTAGGDILSVLRARGVSTLAVAPDAEQWVSPDSLLGSAYGKGPDRAFLVRVTPYLDGTAPRFSACLFDQNSLPADEPYRYHNADSSGNTGSRQGWHAVCKAPAGGGIAVVKVCADAAFASGDFRIVQSFQSVVRDTSSRGETASSQFD